MDKKSLFDLNYDMITKSLTPVARERCGGDLEAGHI
jgi:hypothetical protein